MTNVCPALWPPWKRTTTSARAESQSTILPLPSSPHWAPITATFDIIPYPDHCHAAGIALGTVATYSGKARPLSGRFWPKRNQHRHAPAVGSIAVDTELFAQESFFQSRLELIGRKEHAN